MITSGCRLVSYLNISTTNKIVKMDSHSQEQEDKLIIRDIYKHITKNDIKLGRFLYKLARRYRFAGYIGSIMYLDDEIKVTKTAVYWLSIMSLINFVFTSWAITIICDKTKF